MRYKITLIPGDGIGPEITEATVKVVEATGADIEWDIVNAGADVYEKEGTVLPDRVIDSLKKNKVGIKGPITTPVGTGFRSVNVAMRKLFNLYACVRPCKRDRKSTRLNSSHGYISYAVFCLKKKKKQKFTLRETRSGIALHTR